jgi:hypothetical protein
MSTKSGLEKSVNDGNVPLVHLALGQFDNELTLAKPAAVDGIERRLLLLKRRHVNKGEFHLHIDQHNLTMRAEESAQVLLLDIGAQVTAMGEHNKMRKRSTRQNQKPKFTPNVKSSDFRRSRLNRICICLI